MRRTSTTWWSACIAGTSTMTGVISSPIIDLSRSRRACRRPATVPGAVPVPSGRNHASMCCGYRRRCQPDRAEWPFRFEPPCGSTISPGRKERCRRRRSPPIPPLRRPACRLWSRRRSPDVTSDPETPFIDTQKERAEVLLQRAAEIWRRLAGEDPEVLAADTGAAYTPGEDGGELILPVWGQMVRLTHPGFAAEVEDTGE